MKLKLITLAALVAVAVRAQNNPPEPAVLKPLVQLVEVINTNRPVPVSLVDLGSTNVYAPFSLGFSTGLVICGFGWVLRLVRRVAGPDNS